MSDFPHWYLEGIITPVPLRSSCPLTARGHWFPLPGVTRMSDRLLLHQPHPPSTDLWTRIQLNLSPAPSSHTDGAARRSEPWSAPGSGARWSQVAPTTCRTVAAPRTRLTVGGDGHQVEQQEDPAHPAARDGIHFELGVFRVLYLVR